MGLYCFYHGYSDGIYLFFFPSGNDIGARQTKTIFFYIVAGIFGGYLGVFWRGFGGYLAAFLRGFWRGF